MASSGAASTSGGTAADPPPSASASASASPSASAAAAAVASPPMDTPNSSTGTGTGTGITIVYALHDFIAEAEDEISFQAGDQITVLETDELYNDNWWRGRTANGQIGLFPSTYTTRDKAVMLASRSAIAAVPGGADEPSNTLMGNTMAELDNALKQMQRNPRASYAGTDFSIDNQTDLGDNDDDADDDDDEDGQKGQGEDDFLASQSSAARAALALRAKSNALSATEKERNEAESRKAAAQKRLAEEEERQRALILSQAQAQAQAQAQNTPLSSTTGLQRKPTLTSRIPLNEVELSDDSDSENENHTHLQKRTDKGKAALRGADSSGEKGDVLAPLPSTSDTGGNSAYPFDGTSMKDRTSSSADTAFDDNSILHHSRFDSELPTSFSEVSKLAAAGASSSPGAGAHGAAPASAADANTSTLTDASSTTTSSSRGGAAPSTAVSVSTENDTEHTFPSAPPSAATHTAPTSVGNQTPPPPASDSKLTDLTASPSAQQRTPTSAAVPLPSNRSTSTVDLSKCGPEPEGDPTDWSVEQVAQWGRSKGWDEATIVSKFIEHEITGDVLLEMDVNILKEIEINAFGKRFQVASAIKELKKRVDGGGAFNPGSIMASPPQMSMSGSEMGRAAAADPTAGAAAANGWTVSRSPTPSASASVTAALGLDTSNPSSPLLNSLAGHAHGSGAGAAELAPSIQSLSPQMPTHEVVGVALSPPSNDADFTTPFSAGGPAPPSIAAPASEASATTSSSGPTPPASASASGTSSVPASIKAPKPHAPAMRGPRVSFSQTVEHVPPPPAPSSGTSMLGYASMPSRMRSSFSGAGGSSGGGAGASPRGVLTNAHMPGNPAWASHVVTVASGQGIGNVYGGSSGDSKRDSRSSASSRATAAGRDSFAAASGGYPAFTHYAHPLSKASPTTPTASSSSSSGPYPASTSMSSGGTAALPPGGGTYPPPLLVRKRQSSVELGSANGGAGGEGGNAALTPSSQNSGTASSSSSLRPSTAERENGTSSRNSAAGRAGDRTSFFASLTSRGRKPAPRASQFISADDVEGGAAAGGSGGKGFGARFKRKEQEQSGKEKERESVASDPRVSDVGAAANGSANGHGAAGWESNSGGVGTNGGANGHQNGNGSTATTSRGGAGDAASTTVPAGESVLGKIRPVDLEGWMLKKGDRYGTWKARYIALKGPDLVVLRSPDADKIKGYISMKGYRVIADASANPGKFGFRLVNVDEGEKAHTFSSDDPLAMREWMRALMKSTIGRDHSFPVISSYNNATISLKEAQAMYPPPRPPSPDSRLRVQRANIRPNPNSLSAKDAAILTGLLPSKAGGSLGSAAAAAAAAAAGK